MVDVEHPGQKGCEFVEMFKKRSCEAVR
jgi:hypothetical protein